MTSPIERLADELTKCITDFVNRRELDSAQSTNAAATAALLHVLDSNIQAGAPDEATARERLLFIGTTLAACPLKIAPEAKH